ncbi:hypothetical protein AVEN_234116-1 [Araneus ventricosus]|uniref:Integrase p58-like C-terminal domain-containing protein n=1 Tax=Araneus ventricosus TaxID=182803 RepID=A0A4Y2GL17_ARAVE|nr:hypothetical protein AVEN_234116-1 [Araneus ventricosus]
MISKSIIAKEPLTGMQMLSLEDPVKRAVKIVQMPYECRNRRNRHFREILTTTNEPWSSNEKQTDWDTHLPLFLLAYRISGHEVTGFIPADVLFGRTLRLQCDILFGRPNDTPSSPNEYLNNLEARLESVRAFARERIKWASYRIKTRYNSGAIGHHFKKGDQVWMYNPKRRRDLSPKLQQNCEGPYTIVKKLNDVIYRIQRSPNAKSKVIHIYFL